ncbi:MAG: hypothetical protein ACTSWR_05040 [Candidatus Helarchaeota archaeon]
MRNQANIQDLTVEVVLKKAKNNALQALLTDPVVNSLTQAAQILNDLCKLQAEYLPFE